MKETNQTPTYNLTIFIFLQECSKMPPFSRTHNSDVRENEIRKRSEIPGTIFT
jgi:hypothetical protein